MTNAEYLTWLRSEWRLEALAGIADGRGLRESRPYTPAAMADRASRYRNLRRWTESVGLSLDAMLTTIIEPYVPERRSGVGIFFLDWPCPCESPDLTLADEERGAAIVPADITTRSIPRVLADENPAYRTLRSGFRQAKVVEAHVRGTPGEALDGFVRGCVVGDLVKLQAMLDGETGGPFEAELRKRSCHFPNMYRFAGPLLAAELEHLNLTLVVGFGSAARWSAALTSLRARNWQVHVPADGRGRVIHGAIPSGSVTGSLFVLLPHPQAQGGALQRAMQVLTGTTPAAPRSSAAAPMRAAADRPPGPQVGGAAPVPVVGAEPLTHLLAQLRAIDPGLGAGLADARGRRTVYRPGRRAGGLQSHTRIEEFRLWFPVADLQHWREGLLQVNVDCPNRKDGRTLVIPIPWGTMLPAAVVTAIREAWLG